MEPYKSGSDFEIFLMQLMNYYEITNRTDDLFKSRLLINLLGMKEGSKVMDAFRPQDFTEFSFDEVVAKCKQIFCRRRNTLNDHYQFNLRSQKSRQTLGDFANELLQAARRCQFGDFHDTALRDRFVVGITSEVIRDHLLKMSSNATFSQVRRVAKTQELIHGLDRNRQSEAMPSRIHTSRTSRSRLRLRVDRREHTGSQSRRLETMRTCYECYRIGHYAQNCNTVRGRSANSRTSRRQLNQNRRSPRRNNDDDDGLENTVERFRKLNFWSR